MYHILYYMIITLYDSFPSMLSDGGKKKINKSTAHVLKQVIQTYAFARKAMNGECLSKPLSSHS